MPLYLYMKIVPVNFAERGKIMLAKVVKLLDMNKVAISPDLFPELLTEMRIATADGVTIRQKRFSEPASLPPTAIG